MFCEEQVEQVRPIPQGEFRATYVSKCLLQRQFDAFVAERQQCSTDNDCAIVASFCPFGSGVTVARRYVDAVTAEHDRLMVEYHKLAHCMYRANPIKSVSCVYRRCTPHFVMPVP